MSANGYPDAMSADSTRASTWRWLLVVGILLLILYVPQRLFGDVVGALVYLLAVCAIFAWRPWRSRRHAAAAGGSGS